MAITVFRISTLPIRVDLLKNAAPVVLNQSYPIAEQNELAHDNVSGFKGEFIDSFGYQVSEDGIKWSGKGIVALQDLVGTNLQESLDTVLSAAEQTSYNLYNENLFPINNSTDRIRIIGISGNGILKNGTFVVPVNAEILWHQLPFLNFETQQGGGLPYMTISYQCGNHTGYNTAITYTITINVATLARIDFISRSTINDTIDIGTIENRIIVV